MILVEVHSREVKGAWYSSPELTRMEVYSPADDCREAFLHGDVQTKLPGPVNAVASLVPPFESQGQDQI